MALVTADGRLRRSSVVAFFFEMSRGEISAIRGSLRSTWGYCPSLGRLSSLHIFTEFSRPSAWMFFVYLHIIIGLTFGAPPEVV